VQSNGIALALHGEVQHGASQLIRGFIIADRLERQPRFHQKLPLFETQAVARRFFLATNRCLFSAVTKSACISRGILCRRISRPVGVGRRLTPKMMRWGLLPHWVKDENGQDQMLILVFVSVMAAMPTVLISLLLETQLAGGSPLLFHL
jgi:hypothetical protein